MPETDEILTTGEAAAGGEPRESSSLKLQLARKHLRFTRASCMDFARQLGRVDLVGRGYVEEGATTGGRESLEAQATTLR